MEDLIFITAHCPTEEQEVELEKCINSVKDLGYHVALLSHTHIPIHLQKKCHYYFYDHLNDVSSDVNLLSYNNFSFDDYTIYSRFFQKNFYGFAIYRMFSIASNIAIQFGYKNIHHIEYDCQLLDGGLIEKHSKLLQDFDSVIYTNDGTKDGFLFGSFKSFKVSSLPEYFKNYNRDYIYEEIKKKNGIQLEFFTKDLFIKSGRVYFDKEPTEEKFKRGKNFYSRNIHHTLYYNKEDGDINLFYNAQDKEEKITIIVNYETVKTIDVKPDFWYIRRIGNINEVKHVRIDNSIKVIYDKEFTEEFKKLFKVKSYIKYEKDNQLRSYGNTNDEI